MFLSYLASDFADNSTSLNWFDSYWKKMVFFALFIGASTTRLRLRLIFVSFFVIIFFYELYSWFDFLRGGSFVYQQGMKRMVGTWSDGGYGAPNGFAALGLIALPVSIYIYRLSDSSKYRWLAALAYMTAFLSIVYSGTRGGMLVALAYTAFKFRTVLFQPKLLLLGAIAISIAIPNLPEKVRHRYWDLIVNIGDEPETKTDKIAAESAASRVQGLFDGLKIGLKNPIIGFGPGTSAITRANYYPMDTKAQDATPQLHNLFGQIPAEVGYLGFSIWILMILLALKELFKIKKRRDIAGDCVDG